MMRRFGIFAQLTAMLALLVSAPAFAQSKAKPKGKERGCFTKQEQAAEQAVRHGIFLREIALRCVDPPWSFATEGQWREVDSRFGPDFARETEARRKAFEREFPANYQSLLEVWDGRLVMQYRHAQLSRRGCQDVADQLKAMLDRGFATFRKQAAKVKPDVRFDYKICPGGK